MGIPKKERLKEPRIAEAIKQIQQMTGVTIDREHLFLEDRWHNNSRLKLAIHERGEILDLVRVPDSFFFVHSAAVLVLIATLLFFLLVPLQEAIGIVASLWVATAGGYWLTAWINERARKKNPILSYHTAKQVLRIKALDKTLPRDDLCFLMSLQSTAARAYKPEGGRTELKLIYQQNGQIKSEAIAKGGHGGVGNYDQEILPYAKTLGIRLLHVYRPMHNAPLKISFTEG